MRWSPAEGGGPTAQDEAQRGEARLKFKKGARRSGSHRRGEAAAAARWKTIALTALTNEMLSRREEGAVEALRRCEHQRMEEIYGEFHWMAHAVASCRSGGKWS
jgi:hypothetical protein